MQLEMIIGPPEPRQHFVRERTRQGYLDAIPAMIFGECDVF